MICLLCGRTVTDKIDEGKLRCSHCGLYIFTDGEGNVIGCSENDTLYVEPEATAEASSDEPVIASEMTESDTDEAPTVKHKPYGFVRALFTVILAISLTVCTVGAFRHVKDRTDVLNDINEARELIKGSKYEEAYKLLLPHKNNPEAEKLLSHFVFKPRKEKTSSDNITREYYENGLIKSELNTYTNTNYATIKLYHYDDSGKLIRMDLCEYSSITNKAEDAQYFALYTYRDDGLLESISYLLPSGAIESIESFTYDDKNRCIYEEYTYSSMAHEYDKNDRIIKTTHYVIAENSTAIITTVENFTYDDKGNCVKETISHNDSINDYDVMIKRTFDDYGNVLTEEQTSRIDSNTETDKYVYDYVYDDFGNVLKEYRVFSEDRYHVAKIYDGYTCYFVP